MSSPTTDVAIGLGFFLFLTICMMACLLTELMDCLLATKSHRYSRVAVEDTDNSKSTARVASSYHTV